MKLIVTKYGANWCAPCRLMSSAWKRIEKEYDGRATFREVDTDTDAGRIEAVAHGVMGLPVILFQNYKEVIQRVNGAMTYAQLKKQLDSLLT